MLPDVRERLRSRPARIALPFLALLIAAGVAAIWSASPKAAGATQTPAPGAQGRLAPNGPLPQSGNATSPAGASQTQGLSVVVLDPAHGGTDTGARGAGGIRESDLVLDLATMVRRSLEQQGFQVVETRMGNDNPSFDDRSARANAQRGAVLVSLHIGSSGIPGTARTYVMTEMPEAASTGGLIPWRTAQAPYLSLSKKLGDLVQGQLSQQFKGSPGTFQQAAVRQLRTTAAPAIAVELSSVTVEDRAELDRMMPGVADAIARGVAAFRPLYVVATPGGSTP